MRYANEIIDSYGYAHSIDMVTIDYLLKCSYKSAEKMLLELFGDSAGRSLDNVPNFKYEYYVDMIWMDGIRFHLGKYSDYDKDTKKWHTLDMLRLKVNPNKHVGTDLLGKVVKWLNEYACDGVLVRYDYAIDIECADSDIFVVGSRKDPGLYRGTRYFGRRHKHGYLKIYDKSLEQKLQHNLMRIEYTFVHNMPIVFDNIVVKRSTEPLEGAQSLSSNNRLVVDMLTEIKALGGQIEPYIGRMNYRTWKKIEPYVMDGVRLEFDNLIHDKLIDKIKDIFIVGDSEDIVNDGDDDFIKFSGSLPWEQ